ncbi:MAG: hypothetical protein J6W28_03110 [Clostridia bacterium]|nr:hypothetical protein [Clostridia bacterium]
MIPYVEVLTWNAEKTALSASALVEPSECWFELSYYEIGQFEMRAASLAEFRAIAKEAWTK